MVRSKYIFIYTTKNKYVYKGECLLYIKPACSVNIDKIKLFIKQFN